MQSSLVDFAVRKRAGGRRLTLAEADPGPVGDALAVLLEDPGGKSAAWSAAVSAYGRIWTGYKSFQPIMDVSALLEHVIPSLGNDNELVAAFVSWNGRRFTAWALPAALVVVLRGDRLHILDDAGFCVVEPDSELRAGATGEILRHGQMELEAEDRFVLVSRSIGARIGLWRLHQALKDRSLRGAMREVESDTGDACLILGQVDNTSAPVIEEAGLLVGASTPAATESPFESPLESSVEPLVGSPTGSPIGATVATAAMMAGVAQHAAPAARDASGVEAGVQESVLESAKESAEESANESMEEIVEESVSVKESIKESVEETAMMESSRMSDSRHGFGQWEEVGEPDAHEPEPSATSAVRPLVEELPGGRPEDACEPARSVEEEVIAVDSTQWTEEHNRRPEEGTRQTVEEAAEEPTEDMTITAGTAGRQVETGGIFLRNRRRRHQRLPEGQGSLFSGRPARSEPEEPEESEPSGGASRLVSALPGARLRSRRLEGDPSGQLVMRGLTWLVLGTSVVLTLAIIILLARFVNPPDGPRDNPSSELPTVTETTAPSSAPEEPTLPPLQVFRGANWTHALEQQVTSSPVLVGDLVVFGCRDGVLYGLTMADGTERWRLKIGSGIGSSPLLYEDRVIVGTYDGAVIAVAHADGTELWRFTTGNRVVSSPAMAADGVVTVGCNDHKIYGLSVVDGSLRWQVQARDKVWASPVVSATNRIVVGSHDRTIYCVDGATGEVVWHHPTRGPIYSSAGISGDRVAVGSADQQVHALSLADGSLLWSHDAGSEVSGAVTATDDAFIVGCEAGELLCLEAADGQPRWSFKTSAPIKSRPRIKDNFVWFTGYDEKLHVVDMLTGEERWDFAADGSLFSSPAIAGRTAFFGSMKGTFYAATWSLEPEAATP